MQTLLVVTPGSDPLRRLASMTLIERNHLTTAHAGTQPILIWCPNNTELADRLQGRLADAPVRVVKTTDALRKALDPNDATLVLSASRVHDKRLGSVMATPAERPLALTEDPGSPLLLAQAPSDAELDALQRQGLPGLRELLGDVQVATTPAGYIDVEVVDDASAKRAENLLWVGCRKPIDGWVSTYLNRYISLAISRRLVNSWVLPNHISVFCILLGFAALFLVLTGTYWGILGGAFALKANSVIDGVDGELARVRWQFSPVGELLDSLGDNISNFAFFGALVYVLFERQETLFASLGLAGLLMWSVHLVWIYVELHRKRRGDEMTLQSNTVKAATGFVGKVVDLLGSKVLRRDGFVMLSLIFALFAWNAATMIMVLIGGAAVFLNVVGHYVFAPAAASQSAA